MVTLAPELPGAIETTQRLVEAGVVVSLGHTACGRDDYRAARRAGASHVTHLFNAMQSPEAVRGEPYAGVRPVGLEELALVDDDVSIDLVVDSECAHVATAVLESALRCKPDGTVSLISDSMAAGGLPPGEHRLADGRTIHTCAHHDVARLPGGLLCGSTMSMAGALRNAVRQLGVPVATALRMASEAPARVLGIGDRIGRIGVGAAADLTILSSDLHVRTTIVGGSLPTPPDRTRTDDIRRRRQRDPSSVPGRRALDLSVQREHSSAAAARAGRDDELPPGMG